MKMQRVSHRESVLLGYSPQKTFMDSSSCPDKNPDIDFNDVFGGPPRRSSIQESRYSFSENNSMDSYGFRRSDERASASRNPWSGVNEKPVFGEEAGMSSRRRHSRNGFFDDIFRGNECLSCSPTKYEMKDPFSPGSTLLSPARPLPPKAEPFGSSFPAQFSLPAKLNKGMGLPTFGSPARSSAYKSKDGSSNASSHYAFSPVSRFSGQPNQDKEEVMRNDFQSSRCFNALPLELSVSSEELTNLAKHGETETSGKPKVDSNGSENGKKGSEFHFSIYKWADKGGVPLAIPLRGSDKVKEKDKLQRCSSANGWIACENIATEPKANQLGSFWSTDRVSRNANKYFRLEHDKNENGSLTNSRDEDGEPARVIAEDNIPTSESEIVSSLRSSDKHVSTDTDSHNLGEEKTHHSFPPTNLRDKGKKKVFSVGKETNKPQPKPLNLLFDEDSRDKITRNAGAKETTTKLSDILDGKNIKKLDVKKATSNNVEASETSVKQSPRNSWDNGKTRVRGKVKDFIKIFNQDASSKPRPDTVSENYSSRRKERDTVKPENEPSIIINKRDEKTHMSSIQKKKSSPNIPVVDHMRNGASEKNINSSVKDHTVSSGSGSKTIIEDPARSFEYTFLIEDLTPEEKILPQLGIDPVEIQAIDAKIRQWSNGKQENIRSLLSTLQYVLWPDSGWKPVPLVDIIEGPSVKRSYQKALLCLHPDKLQQKGASSDQKYIAEKVFDILQDAWTHFNSLGSL